MARFRILGLTLLALAVPTFAFGGEEAPSGPQALSVSASLGGCGLANSAIVCQINVSWDALEGADYYTVSVTRPDGSVLDLGQGGGAGRTLFVPYVGSGSYSVQVAAWGTPPGEDEPEVLAHEQALSTDSDDRRAGAVASEPGGSGPAGEGRDTNETAVSGTPEDGAEVTEPPVLEPPACAEAPEEEAEPATEELGEAEAATATAEALAADVAAEGVAEDVPTDCP